MLVQYWISTCLASKKAVPKFLSVSNIVIAPAKTGKDNNNKNAVTKTDQANNGILCNVIPGVLIFNIVVIKFTAPKIDEAPAKCKLNIARSITGPGCPALDDNGGYKVHPPPTPCAPGGPSAKIHKSNKIKEAGNNQKEILFILGKAISGAPIIIGTNQLPNPPIIAGITIKKIIINPWPVTNTLYK